MAISGVNNNSQLNSGLMPLAKPASASAASAAPAANASAVASNASLPGAALPGGAAALPGGAAPVARSPLARSSASLAHAYQTRPAEVPASGAAVGGGQLMQGIEQALNQMGISLNPQAVPAGQAVAGDGAANARAPNPQQALHQLMHDILTAVNQQQASANTGRAANSPYTDFSTGLQNLINSLNSAPANPTTPSNATLIQLQSDFSNFLSAVQGAKGTTSAPTAKSESEPQNVQTFLRNLQANLGSGPLPVKGSLIGTTS